MELQRMRYALAVAEHEHFGHAAVTLGIRQPALSQQIKALEEDIGVRLFDRGSNKVSVTPSGEAFLEYASHAVAAAEQARTAAERTARGDAGQLKLGFVASSIYQVLPRLLRTLRLRHPDIKVTLNEVATAEQTARLCVGDLDLGLLRPRAHAQFRVRLSMLPIGHEPLMAFVPADSPLARRRSIPIGALAEAPFVLPPRELEPACHDEIFQLARGAGFEPEVAQYPPSVHSVLCMVAAGYGVSLGPASIASVTHPGVTCRPLVPRTAIPDLTVAWRHNDPAPAVTSFVKVAQEFVAATRS